MRDECSLDGMGAGRVTADRVRQSVRQGHRLGFPGQMPGVWLSRALRGDQILGKGDLVDALPVASIGQVGLTIRRDQRAGVDSIGHGVGLHIRSLARSSLDDRAVIVPAARARRVRCCYADGAVATSRLAHTVVAVVSAVNNDDGRRPGCSTVTLGNDTVGIEYLADLLPRTSHARRRVNEHVLPDMVQIVLITDMDDGGVVGFLLSLASRREAIYLDMGERCIPILLEARTERNREETKQA